MGRLIAAGAQIEAAGGNKLGEQVAVKVELGRVIGGIVSLPRSKCTAQGKVCCCLGRKKKFIGTIQGRAAS